TRIPFGFLAGKYGHRSSTIPYSPAGTGVVSQRGATDDGVLLICMRITLYILVARELSTTVAHIEHAITDIRYPDSRNTIAKGYEPKGNIAIRPMKLSICRQTGPTGDVKERIGGEAGIGLYRILPDYDCTIDIPGNVHGLGNGISR